MSDTSQRQDTSGGLYDFPLREYSTQGRWPSPDPIGLLSVCFKDPQTQNRYAYVRNNPMSFTDPTGGLIIPGGGGGGGGGFCSPEDPFCGFCDPFLDPFCGIGSGGGGGGGGTRRRERPPRLNLALIPPGIFRALEDDNPPATKVFWNCFRWYKRPLSKICAYTCHPATPGEIGNWRDFHFDIEVGDRLQTSVVPSQ